MRIFLSSSYLITNHKPQTPNYNSYNFHLHKPPASQTNMGPIKAAIQMGTLYGIAHQGFKAYGNHQQQQQEAQVPQQFYSQREAPQAIPQQYRDASGYLHQGFCNGTCGGRCNGDQQQTRDTSYVHQTWCSGQCGRSCNDGQTLIQHGESQVYFDGKKC